MWPTPSTFWYLLLGLLPIMYLGWLAFKHGTSELYRLRFIVVLILWVGYQLSPWMAFSQGTYWESFLLSPDYLDTALLFSALSMYSIILGYGMVFREKHVAQWRSKQQVWPVPRVHWRWVVVFSVGLLAIVVYLNGGLSDLWDASYVRGGRNWRERTAFVRFERSLTVLVSPLIVFTTVLATLHVLYRPTQFNRYIVGVFGIMVAMLEGMHGFSRMTGFPLLLAAFLVFRFRRLTLTTILSILLLSALALFLGKIGFEQRGHYGPGVGNYLHAAFVGDAHESSSGARSVLDPTRNTLDATAAFSRQAEALEVLREEGGVEKLPSFLFHINPVPSGILDPGRIGVGLSDYMGTVGKVGLTTPALADIFKAFGYSGLLVLVLLGCVLGYFDRYAVVQGGLIPNIAILLVVIGSGISLHSGVRAWTRPMLYAAVLIAVVQLFRKRLSRSSVLIRRSKR